MASVKVTERIHASAAAVWALIGDFGGVASFSPGIEQCTVEGEGVGAVRTLVMPGGIRLRERLEAFDATGRSLSYSIVGASPLPAENYLSTIRVSEEGESCTVEWSGSFEPKGDAAAVKALFEGVYRGGIAGLRKALDA